MANRHYNAVLRHFARCQSNAGVSADVYDADDQLIASDIVVVPSSRQSSRSDSEGMTFWSQDDDILVLRTDLEGHCPEGGDKFAIKIDGFGVSQINVVDRSPSFSTEDNFGLVWRVHTKVMPDFIPPMPPPSLTLQFSDGTTLQFNSGEILAFA